MAQDLYQDYNPVARRHTSRQFTLVVMLLALVLAVVVLLTAEVAGPQAAPGSRSVAAHIATIFLTLPLCAVTLVICALLVALWVGLIWLMRKLPPIFKRAHDLLVMVLLRVQQVTQGIVAPLIALYGTAAGMAQFVRRVRQALFP